MKTWKKLEQELGAHQETWHDTLEVLLASRLLSDNALALIIGQAT